MKYMTKSFVTNGDDFIVLEPEEWSEEQYKAFCQVFGLKEADRIVIREFKLEAYAAELSEDDWEKAVNHLNWMFAEYASIGWTGQFGIQGVLIPLKKRYDAGDRSVRLYDEIMALE